MAARKQVLAERLFGNCVPVPESGCWIWEGYLTKDGYGQITISDKGHRTHRVAWELVNGPIPHGMLVCHRCDTPTCINPNHLFIGSHSDNLRDAMNKGRKQPPPNPGKLTAEQVVEIRNASEKQSVIAKKYGIVQQMVSSIKLRQTWKHVE